MNSQDQENDHLLKAAEGLIWQHRYDQFQQGEHDEKWFNPPLHQLDPDVLHAIQTSQITKGKVLEIGTGFGQQAIQLAKMGFEVTATDAVKYPLEKALEAAQKENVAVQFLQDNFLITQLNNTFDIILDRGCLTIIKRKFWPDYLANVHRLLAKDGGYFLKLNGRFRKPEFEDAFDHFKPHFQLIEKKRTTFQGDEGIEGRALFCVFKKR